MTKRMIGAREEVMSALKRQAADTLTSSSPSPSSVTPPVELRIALLPPLPKPYNAHGATEQEHKRLCREDAMRGTQPPPQSPPHFTLPSESTDALYDLIMQLPDRTLLLTHFTITSATDDSHSFDSQHAFDSWIAALPLTASLRVKGQTACLTHQSRLLDTVDITLTLTLSETVTDGQSTIPPSSHSLPDTTPAFIPRVVHVDDSSVQLTTSFRLLPDLTIPLSARLNAAPEWRKSAAKQTHSTDYKQGGIETVFELAVDSTNLLLHRPLPLSDVLAYHRQRVLDGGNAKRSSHTEQYSPNSIVPAFLSLCPTVHLSSIRLAYEPRSGRPITVYVVVESNTDVQLRGFHIVRPHLRFQLHSHACGDQLAAIVGHASATFTIAGSDGLMECSVDVSLTERVYLAQSGDCMLKVSGDCLSVLRMADVLKANIFHVYQQPVTSSAFASFVRCLPSVPSRPRPPSPPPLSSFTALPWTLDQTLSRQLPCLVPCDPSAIAALGAMDASERWSRVECAYGLTSHTISAVSHQHLTFGVVDPSSPPSSDSTLSTCVVLESAARSRACVELLHFHIGPFSPTHHLLSCTPIDLSSMSLAQLISLIMMPTDLVPPSLRHRVQCSQVNAVLAVVPSTGVAMHVTGAAHCGRSKRDAVLFFSRLAPTAVAPTPGALREYSWDTDGYKLIRSPINHLLRLQCRAVLDSAVFPPLATLTAGRCMEPLYQYVLCDTEGGVELTAQQTKAFKDAHLSFVESAHGHLFYPLTARPTNAVLALQPHLPSGYVELPLTALAPPPLPSPPHSTLSTSLEPTTLTLSHFPSSASSSSPTSTILPSQSSGSSRSLVDLAEGSVELFRHCIHYLDTNSLLYGLIPAVRSLPSITAALTSRSYGRRVLLSRYGAWCDAELWDEQLLSEWRVEGFDKQRAEVKDSFKCDGSDREKKINGVCQQLDREETRAHRHDVYRAAVIDLQTRVNKYLVHVMLQRKEDILPQLYERSHTINHPPDIASSTQSAPPGTVRPVYTTVPDAAMELLLCVPPFHSVPTSAKDHDIATTEQCSLSGAAIDNPSPHHIDFAGLFGCEGRSEIYHVWALYMGPVYVYENEHTAGRGCAVDMGGLTGGEYEAGRAVRQLYIEDVNQLPVALLNSGHELRMYSRTPAACFRARGVSDMSEQTRATWRAGADKSRQQRDRDSKAAAESDGESDDGADKEKEKDEQQEATEMEDDDEAEEEDEEEEGRDEDEDEDEDGDDSDADDEEDERNDVMADSDGSKLEYVVPLMKLLFAEMQPAMRVHDD